MISLFRCAGKRVAGIVLALIMIIGALPASVATSFAAENRISFVEQTITSQTDKVTINIEQNVTSGIFRIVQMDSSEDYVSEKLNDYDSLYFALASNMNTGANEAELTKKPTAGYKIYAVLRDSSGSDNVDYVAGPLTVSSGEDTAVPTEQEILNGCSVTIQGFDDGKIKEDIKEIKVNVKLHESVESCYLIVEAYPGNAVFDPDVYVTERLFAKSVKNGDEVTCTFSDTYLPLEPGQKVCAYLNVPVAEDRYKIVQSRHLEVVDENGQGFVDYTYPEVHITDEKLTEGDMKLHITFTADERLLRYASDPNVDFSMTVSIQQYPADEKFDFEGEYMEALISPMNVTEAMTEKEITLSQPLKAGYRARAVVYWTQNNELWIPKSNDYEAAGIPDDSVLISSAETEPELSIVTEKINEDTVSVNVNLTGSIKSGDLVLVRQIPTVQYDDSSPENKLFGSLSVTSAGSVTVEKSEYGKELEAGKYIIAVLKRDGNVIAQSDSMQISTSESGETDSIVLEAVTDVYAGAKTVDFNVSYNADKIPSGMIVLYKAGSDGEADPWGDSTEVGRGTLAIGEKISVNISGDILEGDIIVPYIYHYDAENDNINYYKGTPFTILGEVQAVDSIAFEQTVFTTESETATVKVNGYESFKDSLLFLKLTSDTEDLDGGTTLGSKKYTGSGDYTFEFSKEKMEDGKYVIAYLYKYDVDADLAYYTENNPYIKVERVGLKETSLEIVTTDVTVDTASIYVRAEFDNSLSGDLKIYAYTVNEFDIEEATNKLLYSGTADSSQSSKKIDLNGNLAEGDKIIAVLLLKDTSGKEYNSYSEPVTVKAAPQIKTPSARITETKISEGDVSMRGQIEFEKYYYDNVQYTVYNYTGETLDEGGAKILSEGKLYSPINNMTFYFKPASTPLAAGSKIVICLSVTKGGETQKYYSNVKVVDPAPDWEVPTITFDEAAVKANAVTIPLTVKYDEEYLNIEGGYYCNVTVYQFPSSYSDEDFHEKELHETPIAVRVGMDNADEGEVFTKIEIPVTEGVLEAGNRVIAKLRLPHPEWEGEEADYLSSSVPVIGDEEEVPSAKVLLYQLGEDTEKGKALRSILKDMNIGIVTVEKSRIEETVGYLAGLDGFEATGEIFSGAGYDTEFMLMSGFSDTQLDEFLVAMNEDGVKIDHKAVVTEHNKYWTFKHLMDEIEDEHQIFQAILELDKMIKKAQALNEKDYTAEEWAPFKEALNNAVTILQQETPEPSLEDYKNAASRLKSAYEVLTGETEPEKYSVKILGSYADEDGSGSYAEGEKVKIFAGSKKGYSFDRWKTLDVELNDKYDKETYFIMPAHSVEITAKWDKKKSTSSSVSLEKVETVKRDIEVEKTVNGKVSLEKDVAAVDSEVVFTVTPDEGYLIKEVYVEDRDENRISVKNLGGGKYSFTMPSSRVKIVTVFEKINENSVSEDIMFADVMPEDWYYEAVKYVFDNGIMSGTADRVFNPDGTTSRGMIAYVLWRIGGQPEAEAVAPFLDVTSDKYYAEAVAWANENKVISGVSDAAFAPDSAITREQLASMLYRYAQMKGEVTADMADLSRFTDNGEISAYAVEALQWAVAKGIISGDNGMLNPSGNATRAQAAMMIMKFCER